MNLDRISGLWIGKSLSTLEKLSISSFIKNGHKYYLYVYDDVFLYRVTTTEEFQATELVDPTVTVSSFQPALEAHELGLIPQ